MTYLTKLRYYFLLLAAAVIALPGCNRHGAAPEGPINLTGAGASFPFPLYSKWVAEYQRTDPRVHINYQSVGSGAGIRQISERTVDFGASDAPMTDEQLSKAPAKLIHVPTSLGAVVITYNLPGVTGMRLDGDAIAALFLGQVTSWNDPKLVALNPGVALPAQQITVVHRTDGSGTTAVFTDYLTKVNAPWKDRVGKGTSVNWPVGLGAKGNEGVTGQIKTTPGSIGYTELAYALQNQLPIVSLQNAAHRFVAPSIESIVAAAASVAKTIPDDLRVSIVDPPGEDAYPIASFTYILVYEDNPNAAAAEPLAKFLWWAIHEGQKFSPQLHYAPLPAEVIARLEPKLKNLRSSGRALLSAR